MGYKGQSLIAIEFKSDAEDEWGLTIDFDDSWYVQHIYPGKQADRLGVRIKDQIESVDGIELNERTSAMIKKILSDGDACEITFIRQGQPCSKCGCLGLRLVNRVQCECGHGKIYHYST